MFKYTLGMNKNEQMQPCKLWLLKISKVYIDNACIDIYIYHPTSKNYFGFILFLCFEHFESREWNKDSGVFINANKNLPIFLNILNILRNHFKSEQFQSFW